MCKEGGKVGLVSVGRLGKVRKTLWNVIKYESAKTMALWFICVSGVWGMRTLREGVIELVFVTGWKSMS